jgi:hypothetical protein
MNQLSERDTQQHIQILGWLLIVGHALSLAIGVFVFMLLISIGAVSGDQTAWAVLSVVGTSVGLLLALLALPGIAAGYGLLKGRPWGRVLAIVVAVLGLINFPVGTAIGIYALWVLLQPAATNYFLVAAPRAS